MPRKSKSPHAPAKDSCPTVAYRLGTGALVHADCYAEDVKHFDSALGHYTIFRAYTEWPPIGFCVVCKSYDKTPNLDSPAVRGTWIAEKWRKSTPKRPPATRSRR